MPSYEVEYNQRKRMDVVLVSKVMVNRSELLSSAINMPSIRGSLLYDRRRADRCIVE